MTSKVFPDHPFWNYSLRLYAQSGVSDAAIFLQDEFGLDVNLVLFCIWSGAEGPGKLEHGEVAQAMSRGHQWQKEVVECFRDVRRRLKQDPLGSSTQLARILRPQVQSVELAAEHVEQLFLAEIVPLSRGQRGIEEAAVNLSAYLSAAGIDPTGSGQDPVLNILSRAFPDSPRLTIREIWLDV